MQARLEFDLTSPKVRLGVLGRQNRPHFVPETGGDLPIHTIYSSILRICLAARTFSVTAQIYFIKN
jgi:hypothetical protein